VDYSKLPQIGDAVQVGGWTVTVINAQKRKAVYFYDSSFVADGHFLILTLAVTNNQSGTSHFGEEDPWVTDRPGNVYRDSWKGSSYAEWMGGGKDGLYTDVNPGETREIVIAYDLPDNVRDVQLSTQSLVWIYLGDFEAMQSED
jgi:hypothetical protein